MQFTRECQEMGVPYVYSPIWQIIRLSAEELAEGVRGAKVVVANDYEYELIRDKTGLDQHDILDHAEMVVTTKGKHGSVIMTRDEVAAIPAATAHRGGRPCGRGRRLSGRPGVRSQCRHGYHSGGARGLPGGRICHREYGTQAHSYTREEFAQRYKENFGEEPVVAEALACLAR